MSILLTIGQNDFASTGMLVNDMKTRSIHKESFFIVFVFLFIIGILYCFFIGRLGIMIVFAVKIFALLSFTLAQFVCKVSAKFRLSERNENKFSFLSVRKLIKSNEKQKK